ncbi:MAG TPA: hypothetical protein EYQ50_26180 [Verrucomicrobiales bacterium]|nr:hypothetical protein [Verrucomicrobiales bacterium]
MSLINDALKRAGRAPRKELPKSYVETGSPSSGTSTGSGKSPWVLVGGMILGAVILLAAAFFIWMSQKGDSVPLADSGNETLAKTQISGSATDSDASTASNPVVPSEQQVVALPEDPVSDETETVNLSETGGAEISQMATSSSLSGIESNAPKVASPVIGGEMISEKVESPSVPVPAAETVDWPKLKLSGIFFRANNPSILVNGRTLFVGDEVEGVQVVAITRHHALNSKGGETKTLTMY